MCRLLLFLLILEISYSAALDTTPVLIQDDGLLNGLVESEFNPFKKTSQEEFELIIDKAQKVGDTMLFFVEDNLSYEDITSKDELGTAYFHMKKAFLEKKVKIFSRVVEPYNYLKTRFQPFDFNTFRVRSTATKLRLVEDYKFMYIFFDDGSNETRFEKLRRHDTIIQQVFFAVKQLSKGTVIAFYTGKQNPMEIPRESKEMLVDDDTDATTPATMVKVEGAQSIQCGKATSFQFEECVVVNGKPRFLKPTQCKFDRAQSNEVWAYHIILVPVNSEDEVDKKKYFELRFIFTFEDQLVKTKGWKLIRIVYLSSRHGILKTQRADIRAPFDQFYQNKSPLVMEPDDKSTYEPSLFLKTFRIFLTSEELISDILRYGDELRATNKTESDNKEKKPLKQGQQTKQEKEHPLGKDKQMKQEKEHPPGKDEETKQEKEHPPGKDEQTKQEKEHPLGKDKQIKQEKEHPPGKDEQTKQEKEHPQEKDKQIKKEKEHPPGKDEQIKQEKEHPPGKDEQTKQEKEHPPGKVEETKKEKEHSGKDEQTKQEKEHPPGKDEQTKQEKEHPPGKDAETKQEKEHPAGKDEQTKQEKEHPLGKDDKIKQENKPSLGKDKKTKQEKEHPPGKDEQTKQDKKHPLEKEQPKEPEKEDPLRKGSETEKEKESLRGGGKEEESEEVYVTVGIASSFLVVVILLVTLSTAVTMLMNIGANTNLDTADTKPLYSPDMTAD